MADGLSFTKPGEEWDQIALRRLGNDDCIRVCHLRYGRELIVQFGNVKADDPGVYEWSFEMRLGPEDVLWMGLELVNGVRIAEAVTDSKINADAAKIDDLENKVVAAHLELKELKDAADQKSQ